ncbi:tRNA cyclic N6-threonylcarbamoyladenosine(37) synthase TcdA [Motiliproteus sp. MSK22-1]|uniref:tRNA cyclic N6-threonylcarbamoyladenosine(37) synthase TcdA n=1 Tax=Motiliproteus sp. MSK22-1 TaxID=1897630 RepID=UPI000977B50D|nr:tRNA cyclic N6-threonylcarbamoyladenosine(37) synthase TcdA [Motiliproteus sp. MSK22-1]OMH32634.1 tRNA cyclic N6-threonylcarbamoyladenosine(37) synthase TcdA [Motiliproteus sp. MSK22-1]
MTDELAQRFSGTARLYGTEGLVRLSRAHVCVVGIGGVGSWAAEALARTAIGRITLIDLDDLCITNTNRQIHALSSTVGQSKVEVMAERIRQINPACQCEVVEEFLDQDNLQELLDNNYDFVIDAIDSVKAKAAMIAFCRRRKIPIITVGGAGGQMDPTQIAIADLSKTYQDPLAAKVRSDLRRFYGFSKNPKRRFDVPCVFSTEQLSYPQEDGSVCHQKTQTGDGAMRLDCSGGFGAATVVTATFGFVAVSRVIDKIVNSNKIGKH